MVKNLKYKVTGGSDDIMGGKLKGATDTDYFYFFCPKCPDKQILRLLNYEILSDKKENKYNDDFKKKAEKGFTIGFDLYCEKCKLEDYVKISNGGLQCGSWNDSPAIKG